MTEHHIWCNFFTRPREGCEMCDRLFRTYPYETEEERETLHEKYFPETIKR